MRNVKNKNCMGLVRQAHPPSLIHLRQGYDGQELRRTRATGGAHPTELKKIRSGKDHPGRSRFDKLTANWVLNKEELDAGQSYFIFIPYGWTSPFSFYLSGL